MDKSEILLKSCDFYINQANKLLKKNPKTEEEKIADATAAAIAKLIADGVLKQA